jgi:hypothetical protein
MQFYNYTCKYCKQEFTHYYLRDIGLIYCQESEEAFAYFQGYFMDLVIRAFIELKKKLKENDLRKSKKRVRSRRK